jgi:MYXO-CTERM domain-containing protein
VEFKPMKKSQSLGLIGAGILATTVAFVPMTSPASAQTSTTTAPNTTTTQRTYDNTANNDDRGLWGLAGLAGLFGLLGKRREDETRRTTMGEDATVYRDPSRR